MVPDPHDHPDAAIPLRPRANAQPAIPAPPPAQPTAGQVQAITVPPSTQPQVVYAVPAQAPATSVQAGLPQTRAPNGAPGIPATPAPPLSPEQSMHELQKAVKKSREVLLGATTVFPFTLFPDTVTLDREKLTVSHRFFFRVAEVTSIRIEDILSITADVGPFLGAIKMTTRFYDEREPYRVNYLWRHDALRFKRVVQGYIVARQKGVDCSAFPPDELVGMLDKLGQSAPGEEA
jgi:hypothetical protein